MSAGSSLPTLTILSKWEELLELPGRDKLERLLPDYLRQRRWFGSKTRTIHSASLHTSVPIPVPGRTVYYNLIKVEFVEGAPEVYALPLTFIDTDPGKKLLEKYPDAVVACLEGSVPGFLCDALTDEPFAAVLLGAIADNRVFGEFRAAKLADFDAVRGQGPLQPRIVGSEQSNSSIIFGNRLILKCYRRLEKGTNLDLEIGSFLTETGFPNIARVAGAIEFRGKAGSEPLTLAILHAFVPNQGDAWHVTLTELRRFYETVRKSGVQPPELPAVHLLDLAQNCQLSESARGHLGPSAQLAVVLGQRTAELHLALAKGRSPEFAPEPFSPPDQQSLYESICDLHGRVVGLLRGRLADVPEKAREEARQVLERSSSIPGRLARIRDEALTGQRIRCHGDYHLGQVLFTGDDFVILDFEGEPARPLVERRRKTSPLRDVAGMTRSFHYAAYCGLPQSAVSLEPWAQFWYAWTSASFLRSYLTTIGGETLLPASRPQLQLLLDTFLLEKAMYELGYELNHRPDWVRIPLRGIGQLLR